MKKLMTGNEALVQGAWEAGVLVASAYPGTPSTEIIENMSARKEIFLFVYVPTFFLRFLNLLPTV